MKSYKEMSKEELAALKTELEKAYEDAKGKGLKLDMSRGKPAVAQLELSMGMMDCLKPDDYKAENGTDCRNYGVLDGLPEAKRFFAPMLGVKPEELIVYGNSSLNIMYWVMSVAMTNGVLGSTPWRPFQPPPPRFVRRREPWPEYRASRSISATTAS